MILLFHTLEEAQGFYSDGFDDEGAYWYTGMGQSGDMNWVAQNRAVRDHIQDGRDLLFFERARRQGGLWRYEGERVYLTHRTERQPGADGVMRDAIVFGLAITGNDHAIPALDPEPDGDNLSRLRAAALADASAEATVAQRLQNVRSRSLAVKAYALSRAAGICEGCAADAPFRTATGRPFLEVHHLLRLADSGPDAPAHVAALCPNCHRRCHHSHDASEYNATIRERITRIER